MGIRVITAPTVHLIGCSAPLYDRMHQHLAALDQWPASAFDLDVPERCGPLDSQVTVEFAGRTCYQSWQKGRPHREYIQHIVGEKHHSVLEHAQFTFAIAGVSRTLLAELTRHRHLSPSVLSQRYVDHSTMGFVLPPELTDLPLSSQVHTLFRQACEVSQSLYRNIVEELTAAGWDRKRVYQTARSVLPGCVETRLVVSGNARAWLDILPKRDSGAADPEIRRLVQVIHGMLKIEMPDVFGDKGETL